MKLYSISATMFQPPHLDPEAGKVGPEVVRIEDGVLVIYSKRDVSGWVVRAGKPFAGFGNEVASPRPRT